MRKPLITPTPTIAKINVTPIIDVALVLVIILLITAPMLAVRDLGVTLPPAQTRGLEDELRVSITLGPEGELALDEDLVSLQTLANALNAKIAESNKDDVLVVVRADKTAPYEVVREILREARAGGATRLAIATRQRGGRNS